MSVDFMPSNRPILVPGAVLGLALLLAAVGPGCSEDPPTGPRADVVIKVTESNYIPSNVTIEVNQLVEWQNWYREARTVTSGVGPDDPHAGEILDIRLAGYPNGEAYGGRHQQQFTEPDTFYYFSREVPSNFPGVFLGTIIVTP